jgi:calmodulin
LRNFGQNPTEAELQEIIMELDVNNNGTVEFDKVLALITKEDFRMDIDTEITETFALLDRDQKGYLGFDHIKKVVASTGLGFSDDEIREMLAQVSGVNGRVTIKEFQMILVFLDLNEKPPDEINQANKPIETKENVRVEATLQSDLKVDLKNSDQLEQLGEIKSESMSYRKLQTIKRRVSVNLVKERINWIE